MGTREGAIRRTLEHFDGGEFEKRLAELVAIKSTSQNPEHQGELDRYLREGIVPWIERLGFE